MELSYAELSSPGPVRSKNEDCVGCWIPEDKEERRTRGALFVLADGMGGHGKGDIASQLAVETVLKTFQETKSGTSQQQLLTQVFNTANLAVYDKSMSEDNDGLRMGTTLAVVLFFGSQIHVGNVGDSRVYLIHRGQIKQLSTDHSYVAVQRKLGLMSEEESRQSPNRSILTRSVGQDPTIRVDFESETVMKGDFIVLCSDGLHAFVKDDEICSIVNLDKPEQACQRLITLAEQHGSDDNVSVQVVQVNAVDEIGYFRGTPVYYDNAEHQFGDIRPGELLDGRFLITQMISRSGMATVYKATDQTNKQNVAVKIPHMQFESDPGCFARFQQEEAIGSQLNHPYILKFIPIEKKSRPYIVTEYLTGYTLAHLMHNISPLPLRDALKITLRICDALIYLHEQGVIHRDLKPQNVMICYDGSLRILDFGIAKSSRGRRHTFAGFTATVGTPDYMAPEQVKGKRGDERTDIYSLGAMLYEMLTGKTPFDGETALVIMNLRLTGDPVAPRKINPDLSPQIEEIILHAMERNPNKRYDSVALIKADLEAPDQVEVTGRAQRLQTPKPGKHNWRWVRMLTSMILIPLAIGLIFTFFVLHPPHRH